MDELLYDDALDLLAYWKENPPVHVAIAGLMKAFAGKGAGVAPDTARSSASDVEEFVRQFKQQGAS